MNRNSIQKVLAALMAIVLMLTMVACGSQGAQTTIPNNGDAEQETTGADGTQPASDVETGELSYPLNTEDTLTIWCGSLYSPIYNAYEDYTESPWHSGLAEMTGVEVKWQYPVAGADDEQAYNLLLTKEVLPDIISYPCNPAEGELLMEEGAIRDLTELLPKYAPDYWAYITAEGNEDLLRAVSTADGKVYIFGVFLEADYNRTAYGPIIRKDWLEECNLDIPVTIADWEEMLKIFRDKYGAKFCFPSSRFSAAGFASGFGAYSGTAARPYLENGEIKFSATQPEYKEFLGTMARWVKEGLMDVDSITMNDEGFRTKCINNDCGAGFTVMSNFTEVISDAKMEQNGAEWIPVPYPVVAEGQPANWIACNSLANGSGCVVTTSCSEEKLATALKWLNYPYTEEGNLYYNFGVENDTYVINEEGKPEFTDKILNDPDGVVAACCKYTGGGDMRCVGIQMTQFVYSKNNPVVAEGVWTWIGDSTAKEALIPTVYMTPEDNIRYNDLYLGFATYTNEMSMRIISGDVSIDEFDSIVDRCYELGLQEALDIYNAAYDRYLESK